MVHAYQVILQIVQNILLLCSTSKINRIQDRSRQVKTGQDQLSLVKANRLTGWASCSWFWYNSLFTGLRMPPPLPPIRLPSHQIELVDWDCAHPFLNLQTDTRNRNCQHPPPPQSGNARRLFAEPQATNPPPLNLNLNPHLHLHLNLHRFQIPITARRRLIS